jgi:AraC family transcriptional regulator
MESLSIKNMVCDRCIKAVKDVLVQAKVAYSEVTLGQVILAEPLPAGKHDEVNRMLRENGFEVVDTRKAKIVNAIKSTLIQHLDNRTTQLDKQNWSEILTSVLPFEYTYLSTLFSSVEGIPIEKYVIRLRIEKAKELLLYDDLTLSEISDRLGYSSVAHLSAQFKKVTGMSPSQVKKAEKPNLLRKPLDEV